MNPKERIIVPIDYGSLNEANDVIRLLASQVHIFKLGLIAISAGFAHYLGRTLKKKQKKVFWDIKFGDIANTMRFAAEALISRNSVDYFTVHGGFVSEKALAEAVEHRGNASVLVVTVLTDICRNECETMFGKTPEEKVLAIAERALAVGAQGIVCAAKELEVLERHRDFDALEKVAVSVRPSWYRERDDDQKRSLTPGEAICRGASKIIVGRPIMRARLYGMSEQDAFERIAEEVTRAAAMG